MEKPPELYFVEEGGIARELGDRERHDLEDRAFRLAELAARLLNPTLPYLEYDPRRRDSLRGIALTEAEALLAAARERVVEGR